MRKLFILLGFIFAFALSQAQLPGVIASQDIAGGFCAEYQTIYNALDSKPGTDTANAQNTLVVDLKTAGVWAKGDLIYVTAQKTQAGALLMWLNPSGDDNLTNTTAAPFTQYEGFTGVSATSESMTTNWNPTNEAVNYKLDDATISAYTRIDINATEYIMSAYASSRYISLVPRTGGTMTARMNSPSASSYTTANSLGLSTVTRTASNVVTFYKNGTKLGTDNEASDFIPNANLLLFNLNGGNFSNNQVSFIFVGAALTDGEVTAMNTAVEKYMDFIGKGVVAYIKWLDNLEEMAKFWAEHYKKKEQVIIPYKIAA